MSSLPGAEDEARVRIADAGGKLVERARHAGVRIRAEQDLAGTQMPFPRQRGVADAGVMRAKLPVLLSPGRIEFPMPVRVIDHIVKIGDVLLLDEVAQDIDVAVGHRVRGKNVMVRDDDDLVAVPNLRVLAELPLENADGARPADVVGHEHVHFDPHVVARLDAGLPAGAGEQFFGQSHRTLKLSPVCTGFNREFRGRVAPGAGFQKNAPGAAPPRQRAPSAPIPSNFEFPPPIRLALPPPSC